MLQIRRIDFVGITYFLPFFQFRSSKPTRILAFTAHANKDASKCNLTACKILLIMWEALHLLGPDIGWCIHLLAGTIEHWVE